MRQAFLAKPFLRQEEMEHRRSGLTWLASFHLLPSDAMDKTPNAKTI
jgi:hypothetical protein